MFEHDDIFFVGMKWVKNVKYKFALKKKKKPDDSNMVLKIGINV